jgi:hypothetical protein
MQLAGAAVSLSHQPASQPVRASPGVVARVHERGGSHGVAGALRSAARPDLRQPLPRLLDERRLAGGAGAGAVVDRQQLAEADLRAVGDGDIDLGQRPVCVAERRRVALQLADRVQDRAKQARQVPDVLPPGRADRQTDMLAMPDTSKKRLRD